MSNLKFINYSLPQTVQNELQKFQSCDLQIEHISASRTKKGYLKIEVVAFDSVGNRKFFMLKDKFSHIVRKEVTIFPSAFEGSRDDEIVRLRKEEKLTQAFIARIFGISQSRVAQILKRYE